MLCYENIDKKEQKQMLKVVIVQVNCQKKIKRSPAMGSSVGSEYWAKYGCARACSAVGLIDRKSYN